MVQAKQNVAPSTPIRLLPRLAVEASAGKGLISAGEDVEGYVAISDEYLREINVDPRYAHILRVSGRSKAPTINDKDVVIIDTSVRAVASEGFTR
ncbi:S24 family peptidase [Methylorubrum thiocyanatum]|uniref:S24 family peptidase n=1 Tax=Methylorubrum thiocyanatum TaxID=47958 RepID=UPI0035C8435D